MPDTDNAVRASLRRWVVEQGLRADSSGPADGADLAQEGWIDSLGLMGLITHVEDLLGRPLHDRELRMQNFVSIDRIARTLFAR